MNLFTFKQTVCSYFYSVVAKLFVRWLNNISKNIRACLFLIKEVPKYTDSSSHWMQKPHIRKPTYRVYMGGGKKIISISMIQLNHNWMDFYFFLQREPHISYQQLPL